MIGVSTMRGRGAGNGRRWWRDERQRDNQPDKRRKRGAMRGRGAGRREVAA
jgi:hypothetical protein